VLAQNYLQDLLKLAAGAVEGVPVLAAVLTPDRWLLWLFVLSVYYFPTGVVGRLRARVKTLKKDQARGRGGASASGVPGRGGAPSQSSIGVTPLGVIVLFVQIGALSPDAQHVFGFQADASVPAGRR
jgi:hypothetical protein